MEERMTSEEFTALMELLHYSVTNEGASKIVQEWADKEARARGYQSWIEAYNLTGALRIILPKVANTP